MHTAILLLAMALVGILGWCLYWAYEKLQYTSYAEERGWLVIPIGACGLLEVIAFGWFCYQHVRIVNIAW